MIMWFLLEERAWLRVRLALCYKGRPMASSGRRASNPARGGPEAAGEAPADRRERPDPALRDELKRFIVEHLKLPGVAPEAIADDAPLVGGGLDLDSIDVLELVTGVERRYGVRFEDPDLVKQVFTSVGSIAGHIAARRDGR
jgi:acyl carrier protein